MSQTQLIMSARGLVVVVLNEIKYLLTRIAAGFIISLIMLLMIYCIANVTLVQTILLIMLLMIAFFLVGSALLDE